MRTCTDCTLTKSDEEFAKQRAPESRGEERTADGLNTYCRPCAKKRQQRAHYEANRDLYRQKADDWRAANPDARKRIARDYSRKRRWEQLVVTKAIYDRFIEECGNACNGCRRPFTSDLPACIDHDHDTGAARGLLCRPCNLTLGHAYDDPDRLEALAAYLRCH